MSQKAPSLMLWSNQINAKSLTSWHELGPRTNTDKHVPRKRLLRLKNSASLFCKLIPWFRKIGLSYTFSLYEHWDSNLLNFTATFYRKINSSVQA